MTLSTDSTLVIINAALARYGIEPLTREDILEYWAKMPVMSETEIQESLRRLWLKIAENEVLN